MKQSFLFLLLLLPCLLIAQKMDWKQAEQHYKNFECEEAITLYENIIRGDSSNFKVQERLAESFRKTNQYQKAAYWYSKIVQCEEVRPVYFMYYGKMLLEEGQCEASNYWMQKYINATPEEFHYFRHPINCDWFKIQNEPQEDSAIYTIKKLPVINTEHDEIGVNYYKNTLIFTQKSRFVPPIRYDAWHIPAYEFKNYQLSIDTIDLEQNFFNYAKAPREWKKVSYKWNASNFSITKAGRMYFVQNSDWIDSDTTVFNHKIFQTTWENDEYGEITGLPFNSDEYNVNYLYWVESDSILYFASDMPGGFGGYDLYCSQLKDGMYSPPVNLGPRINTEFDEISPFLDTNNQRLYFSSNNEKSLGGYDIFYSKIDENGYSKYIHLQQPINSTEDDLNFICNEKGTHGYFVSDRMGSEFKLDVYEFLKKEE